MTEDQRNMINGVLARLSGMPPISVEAYDESAGDVRHWFTETPVAHDFAVLGSADVERLRALAVPTLVRWKRAAAAAKRVWQIRDRELREWKAGAMIAARTAPTGDDEASKKWKAPSIDDAKNIYRLEPAYKKLNASVERAEEAYNAVLGVIDGWEAVLRLVSGGEQ